MKQYTVAEKVRRGDPIFLPLRAILSASTPVMRLGMWWRLRASKMRVNASVVSFGNLTVGGTGKTPAVIARARRELEAGRRVAILTRGYGSHRIPEPLIMTPEELAELSASADSATLADRVGDEPALIARRVPGVTLVKSADRVVGARAAIDKHSCDTIILDDGFQAVTLERDENILCIDATNPFGNEHLVPRGILREPITAAARATEIILTRCDQAENIDTLIARLHEVCPHVPIRKTRHVPCRLWRVSDGATLPLSMLANETVTALCGIANPEAFLATLATLGATVTEALPFNDHAQIPPWAIPTEGQVVTTEKDAVRLRDVHDNVLALGIELGDC